MLYQTNGLNFYQVDHLEVHVEALDSPEADAKDKEEAEIEIPSSDRLETVKVSHSWLFSWEEQITFQPFYCIKVVDF